MKENGVDAGADGVRAGLLGPACGVASLFSLAALLKLNGCAACGAVGVASFLSLAALLKLNGCCG